MSPRLLITALLTLIVAAVVAQAALANGEPKNELPFTRVVAPTVNDRSNVVAGSLAGQAISSGQGEAKNELPFTRPATGASSGTTSTASGGTNWQLGLWIALAVATAGAGIGAGLRLRQKAPRTA